MALFYQTGVVPGFFSSLLNTDIQVPNPTYHHFSVTQELLIIWDSDRLYSATTTRFLPVRLA